MAGSGPGVPTPPQVQGAPPAPVAGALAAPLVPSAEEEGGTGSAPPSAATPGTDTSAAATSQPAEAGAALASARSVTGEGRGAVPEDGLMKAHHDRNVAEIEARIQEAEVERDLAQVGLNILLYPAQLASRGGGRGGRGSGLM